MFYVAIPKHENFGAKLAFNFFMMSDTDHMLIDHWITHFGPSKLNDLDQLSGKHTEAVMYSFFCVASRQETMLNKYF